MPDDRLIHRCAGHGERANQLSHLEYRVWTQYILSADDFGVMRRTSLTIQSANDALAKEKPKLIDQALVRLVTVALVVQFEHQKHIYICQLDWQTRQKIDYPRGTINPKPPSDVIARCDVMTRKLFALHPGGKGGKFRAASPPIPGTSPEPESNIPVDARERAREEANAKTKTKTNGSDKRLTAQTPEGEREREPRQTLIGSHKFCASHAAGFCVPQGLHRKLIGLCRGVTEVEADRLVSAFYVRVDADPRWSNGPIGSADAFKFFGDRWEEEHGGTPKKSAKELQSEAAWKAL